jgi:hypothetical protein
MNDSIFRVSRKGACLSPVKNSIQQVGRVSPIADNSRKGVESRIYIYIYIIFSVEIKIRK